MGYTTWIRSTALAKPKQWLKFECYVFGPSICYTTLRFCECSHRYMFWVQVQCRVLILFCCIQGCRIAPSFDNCASTIYTLRRHFFLESFQSYYKPYVQAAPSLRWIVVPKFALLFRYCSSFWAYKRYDIVLHVYVLNIS